MEDLIYLDATVYTKITFTDGEVVYAKDSLPITEGTDLPTKEFIEEKLKEQVESLGLEVVAMQLITREEYAMYEDDDDDWHRCFWGEDEEDSYYWGDDEED